MAARTWAMVASSCCVAIAAGVFAGFRTAPGLGDPLGRPVRLAAGIVASAGAIDAATSRLVDRHAELGPRVAATERMVTALDRLEAQAARLGGLVGALDARTGDVAGAAGALPNRISALNLPVSDGEGSARRLQTDIASVSTELERVVASLEAMRTDSRALVPPATAVANHLDDIQKDTGILGLLRAPMGGLAGLAGPGSQ